MFPQFVASDEKSDSVSASPELCGIALERNEKGDLMQLIENQTGAPSMQPLRESTHILKRGGRNGCQQYFDKGFGKTKNSDFEPLHYQNT